MEWNRNDGSWNESTCGGIIRGGRQPVRAGLGSSSWSNTGNNVWRSGIAEKPVMTGGPGRRRQTSNGPSWSN